MRRKEEGEFGHGGGNEEKIYQRWNQEQVIRRCHFITIQSSDVRTQHTDAARVHAGSCSSA